MAKKSDAALLTKLRVEDAPGDLIWLLIFLKSTISGELVLAKYHQLSVIRQDDPIGEALWAGYFALYEKAESALKDLTTRGLLLFAHAGTTVLQGGAA